MNAKFEKWCEDYALDVEPLTVESRRADCKAAYRAGSKDAIQSLEVTDELVHLALNVRVGAFPIKTAISAQAVKDMLVEVLSALKEQAK